MDGQEQLSPELALVDPELAERARASLPEEPWRAFAPPPERRIRSRALVPVIRGLAPIRARRRPVGAVLTAAAVVAVLAVLAFGLLPSRGPRPSFEPVAAPSQAARPPALAATATAVPPSPARPATPPAPRAAPPAAQPPAARPAPSAQPPAARPPPAQPPARRPPPATPPASAPAPSRTPARPSSPPAAQTPVTTKPPPPSRPPPAAAASKGFQPARTFAWAPAPGATYYHVVFRREGKPFYEGFSREPRLTLPRRVQFAPGTYTWTVRPGSGLRSAGREGAPIVESTFTIQE